MILHIVRPPVWVLTMTFLIAQATMADYEAGQRAFEAGQPIEAFRQWQAAANAGDRRAMLALGRQYIQGVGTLQDYVEAHKWLNLAASRGEATALKERDALASKMTPQQVATAQGRAASWGRDTPRAAGTTHATSSSKERLSTASDSEPPPPSAVQEAQGLLRALGYQPGPTDGIWGRRSEEAYRAFLRDVGLPATEKLTPEGLRAMRAIAKRRGGRGDENRAAMVERPSAGTTVPSDALHRAAQTGDIVGLTAALDSGVDVDGRDRRGWTALMYATDKQYPLLVEVLLEARANPNARAPDGATALFMAAAHGHSEIIEQLMDVGADITVRGPDGKTAVEVARARYGDAETAQQRNEPESVLLLLGGKTLAEADAERLAQEEEERERLAHEREPGRVFRDCEACPQLVVVPAGSYMMGSGTCQRL